MKNLWVTLFVAALLLRACFADVMYAVAQNGKPIGSLTFSATATGEIQEAFRSSAGTIVSQASRSARVYEEDWLQDGKVSHTAAAIFPDRVELDEQVIALHAPLVIFDGTSIQGFLQIRFPGIIGKTEELQIINPLSSKSTEGEIENRGFRMKVVDGQPVKLQYFLVDISGTGMNFYSDRSRQVVLVEIPDQGLSYRLTAHAIQSFPFAWWEELAATGESSHVARREVEINGTNGELLLPKDAAVRPPAVLLVGAETLEKPLLFPLAAYLTSKGDAVLLEAGENDATGLRDIFFSLLKQDEINTGRVAVIGVGGECAEVESLAARWSLFVREVVLISPDPSATENAQEMQALKKNGIPVFVIKNSDFPKLSALFFPQMQPLDGAESADQGQEADPSLFEAIASHLSALGMTP